MTATVILVPVLGRPHRVGPLVANVAQVTREPHRLVFIASADDEPELAALKAEGLAVLIVDGPGGTPGDYARKINAGAAASDEPLIFLAADDLRFHPGWLTHATRALGPTVDVVGTNDLLNPRVRRGTHSTHSLVRRSYVEEFGTIDQPGKVLHESYPHEFVDDEFVETAKHRGRFVSCRRSIVEHLHPYAKKAPMDATYEAGWAGRAAGQRLFAERRHLWT